MQESYSPKVQGFLGKVDPPRVRRDLRVNRKAKPMDNRLLILSRSKLVCTMERRRKLCVPADGRRFKDVGSEIGKSVSQNTEIPWGAFSNKGEDIDAMLPGKTSKERLERPYCRV